MSGAPIAPPADDEIGHGRDDRRRRLTGSERAAQSGARKRHLVRAHVEYRPRRRQGAGRRRRADRSFAASRSTSRGSSTGRTTNSGFDPVQPRPVAGAARLVAYGSSQKPLRKLRWAMAFVMATTSARRVRVAALILTAVGLALAAASAQVRRSFAAALSAPVAGAARDARRRRWRAISGVLATSPKDFLALIGAGQGRARARRQPGGGRILRPRRRGLPAQPAAAGRHGRGDGGRRRRARRAALFRPRPAARRHRGDARRRPRPRLRPARPPCRRPGRLSRGAASAAMATKRGGGWRSASRLPATRPVRSPCSGRCGAGRCRRGALPRAGAGAGRRSRRRAALARRGDAGLVGPDGAVPRQAAVASRRTRKRPRSTSAFSRIERPSLRLRAAARRGTGGKLAGFRICPVGLCGPLDATGALSRSQNVSGAMPMSGDRLASIDELFKAPAASANARPVQMASIPPRMSSQLPQSATRAARPRVWVQLASGTNPDALPGQFRRIKSQARGHASKGSAAMSPKRRTGRGC